MSEIPAGAMRFNSDSQKLEYWNGSAWFQVHTATPNLASAGDREPGVRGLFTGGYASAAGSPKTTNKINYVNIASTGNAQEFGTLSSGADQDIVPCGASRRVGWPEAARWQSSPKTRCRPVRAAPGCG